MQLLPWISVSNRNLKVFFSVVISTLVSLSCNSKSPDIYGTYRLFSDDPSIEKWLAGETTFLQLNSNNTIIYNSTMNGKQRFHFEGNFALDRKTNTLTIRWKDGKLPNILQIEKKGHDYIIQIGSTTYKKENAGG